jgi:DNA polymerase III subunit epsilon
MSRQIALDTETTGLEVREGHRIIEVGCIEIINRKITGEKYYTLINPERDIEEGAAQVHGITLEQLQDKPTFEHIADEFVRFIEGAELLIHNAAFDVGFLNAELERLPNSPPIDALCTITDTLALARDTYPRQRNSLDALCARLNIDNSNRTLHGALIDAQILAEVYLAMTGGQVSLSLDIDENDAAHQIHYKRPKNGFAVILPTEQELAAHEHFVQQHLT